MMRSAATKINNITRRILRFIKYPYGPRADKNDPNKTLETLERWSGSATLIILAGIIAEVIVIWCFPPGVPEKIGATAANGLIGIGLIIEYIVILRAIIASGEAKREADEKVAAAEARAAEAIRDAAHANLELAKFRSRRALRPDQLSVIGERIRSFRPKWDMGIADPKDEEQVNFAAALGNFVHAFWVSQLWKGGSEKAVVIPSPGVIGVVMATEVSIQIHPDYEVSLKTAAEALAGALQEVGIAAAIEGYRLYIQNNNNDAIHVLIGPKR